MWKGAESYLLLFLAVVYGYHSLMLLFGTSHCCSILLGELSSIWLSICDAGSCKTSLVLCLHWGQRQSSHNVVRRLASLTRVHAALLGFCCRYHHQGPHNRSRAVAQFTMLPWHQEPSSISQELEASVLWAAAVEDKCCYSLWSSPGLGPPAQQHRQCRV